MPLPQANSEVLPSRYVISVGTLYSMRVLELGQSAIIFAWSGVVVDVQARGREGRSVGFLSGFIFFPALKRR